MRTQLARFTEWAWSNGRAQNMEALSLEFYGWLKQRHPGQAGCARLAQQEILKDMTQILRALSYGGRTVNAIPVPRLQMLREQASQWGWFYLRL